MASKTKCPNCQGAGFYGVYREPVPIYQSTLWVGSRGPEQVLISTAMENRSYTKSCEVCDGSGLVDGPPDDIQ
jgi:RecJ-like exonuclease